ncbi:MAG: hypothetical protein HFG83_05430 [Dorea sp.]|jgi:hypothetical protein|nr:hypothetical protein [Dorea sp.]
MNYSEFYPMFAEAIGSNGYRILQTPKFKFLVAKTIITSYPNGLGHIDWMDKDDKLLAWHDGTLDQEYPRIGTVINLTK